MATEAARRKAAGAFAEEWQGRGYEKGETQPFWLSLLRDVCGVEAPERIISFEKGVKLAKTKRSINGTTTASWKGTMPPRLVLTR